MGLGELIAAPAPSQPINPQSNVQINAYRTAVTAHEQRITQTRAAYEAECRR